MSALLGRTTCILARNGAVKLCIPKTAVMVSSQRAISKPAFVERMFEKLDHLEEGIDEESRIGSNLPFDIKNPKSLAFKFIIFMGLGFNLPFIITYYQMKNAKSSS